MATKKLQDKSYFQHFYSTRNELKILKLRSVHGLAGYGAYWEIIEKLFENGGEMNLSDIPLFAYELHLDENGEEILKSTITDFGLFEINQETGDFTAETVAEQIQYRTEQSEKARKKADARWDKSGQGIKSETNEEPAISSKDLSEKITLFKQRFPNVSIDLNPDSLKRKMSHIDIDKLTEAINESTQLQKINSLLVLCDKYELAIKGYYKDKPETELQKATSAALAPIFPH